MFCYVEKLSDEQLEILTFVNNTQDCASLIEQFSFLCKSMALPEFKLACKLLKLSEYGFLTNERQFSKKNQLGFNLTCDGCVSCFGELITLTPTGLGYLRTHEMLEQLIRKSIDNLDIPPEKKRSIYNKVWEEAKDIGIDFMAKLTKLYISSQL